MIVTENGKRLERKIKQDPDVFTWRRTKSCRKRRRERVQEIEGKEKVNKKKREKVRRGGEREEKKEEEKGKE